MAQGQRDQQQTGRDGGSAKQGGTKSKDVESSAQESERGSLARGGGELQRGGELTPRGGLSSPFGFMRRFMEDLDRLSGGSGSGLVSAWMPELEMFRDGNDVVIRADVPGLREEDIEIEVEDDVLTLSGERRSENREEREGFFRSERSYGFFERSIRLPDGTDPEKIDARLENGVLELRIQAPEEERRAKKIPLGARSERVDEKKQPEAAARDKRDTH